MGMIDLQKQYSLYLATREANQNPVARSDHRELDQSPCDDALKFLAGANPGPDGF